MDVEKTMQFILEQQADFAGHIGALREQQAKSGQQIERLVQVARLQSERLEGQEKRFAAREKRAEAFERRFDQFLERFDTFLRGRRGNGR